MEHSVVFVLTGAIVSVQVHLLLAQAMMREEVMELRNDDVVPLTAVTCLVAQKVDLLWYRLTHTSNTRHFLVVRK